jgi:hypothetical protein
VLFRTMTNETRWGSRGFPVLGSFVLHGLLLLGALMAQRQSVPVPGVPGALTERVLHRVEVSAFNEPPVPARAATLPAAAAALPEPLAKPPRAPAVAKAAPLRAPADEAATADREEAGGWLGIAKPVTEDEPSERLERAAPERDLLVERLLAKERTRADQFRAAALPSNNPDAVESPPPALPVASAGTLARPSAPGDLWASLTQALPAALNPALWNDRRASVASNVRLEARLRDGKLVELKAGTPTWAGTESLRSGLFELLKRGQFSSSRGETSELFEVRVRASMQQGSELPALGYSAPPGGLDGTAYAIFPSGLRIDAVVRRLTD